MVKNLLAKAGDIGDGAAVPGSGRSFGGRNVFFPLQFSCLENPMENPRQPGRLQSIGSQGIGQEHTYPTFSILHFLDLLSHLTNEKSSLFQNLFKIIQFSHSVVSDSLRPHESQHARPPCPSSTPGVYSNPCPSSQ